MLHTVNGYELISALSETLAAALLITILHVLYKKVNHIFLLPLRSSMLSSFSRHRASKPSFRFNCSASHPRLLLKQLHHAVSNQTLVDSTPVTWQHPSINGLASCCKTMLSTNGLLLLISNSFAIKY